MATRKGTRASERIRSLYSSKLEQPPPKKVKGGSKDGTEERRSGEGHSGTLQEAEQASKDTQEPVDLSPMLTMPLDVFQEVLSHLHPRDLILVSRVSRRFREHLLLQNSTVWRMSRERIGAPDGPSHLSEAAWAALLFLPRCQICGEPDVQVVDFFILRRLCSSCRRNNLVERIRLQNVYPQYPLELLELVPYTNLHVSFRSSLSEYHIPYYLLEDIRQVAAKVERYTKITIKANEEKTRLDIFREYQKAKIRTMHKLAPSYQSWFHCYYLKQHIHGNILSL